MSKASYDIVAKQLDEAANQAYELTRNITASFAGSLNLARVVSRIRELLTIELMNEVIMPLKDTQFGWRTDSKNYTIEQYRDAWVSACMVGAKPVNNEVNIISAQCYLAKNYFKRAIKEFPGLTEWNPIPGELKMTPSGALVEYTATWKLNGNPMVRNRSGKSAIPVRLNNGMGADGALGKAERKFMADVLSYVTGTHFSDGEVEDAEPTHASVISNVSAEVSAGKQALPEPAKNAQTRAVTEKLKKAAQDPVQETPDEKAPWDKDPEPEQNATVSQPVAVVEEVQKTAQEPAQEDQPKKQASTQQKAAAKPAAQATTPAAPATQQASVAQKKPVAQAAASAAPTAQAAAPESQGEDVIETEMVGVISAVKATMPGRTAPYIVFAVNGSQYSTMDIKIAQKAKEYFEKAVPATIEYTIQPSGKYMIVDLRPAELGEDSGDLGEEGPPGDIDPA